MTLKELVGIRGKIAEDVCAGKQYRIDCACGVGRFISKEDFAEYLAHGWPKHCGQTMRLTGDSEARREK